MSAKDVLETLDISGDGGIIKEIIKRGNGDATPPKNSKVKVHYVGRLQSNGEVFDSSRDRNEMFTFLIGQGMVIAGWDQGVATMKIGEICNFICKPEYAYGASGSPPTIPPNSTLIFEVELFGWDDPEPDTIPEKIKAALKRKEEGNLLFASGKWAEAAEKYSTACDYFNKLWGAKDTDMKEIDAVKLPCLLNLSAAQLKTAEYNEAVQTCTKALAMDENNIKALFRRGQAYSRLGEYENAKKDLLAALKIQPSNADVRDEYEKLKVTMQKSQEEAKKIYSKMFS